MMFRKPKKIQRRIFCADDDDDGDVEVPPPPVISQVKKETKAAKPAKSTALLSFVDEEEDDGEVFKVKKSSYSKKLSKKRDKEKRKPFDGENNVKYDNDENEDTNHTDNNQDPPKTKKKVTLEGLILSGREALAADGKGDISDGESADDDEEDNRGFHTYRAESVRAALAVAPGHIPDAALIHAARKTRQQARELGDFVPVRQAESKVGSRLVREDGSGDEDEEGRIHVRGLDLPSDKPKRGTEAAPTDAEMDSELEEWEEQQIKKAMPALPDITGDGSMEMNPFSMAPAPPPRLDEGPAHLRPLVAAGQDTPTTASHLVASLRQRLQELQMDRQTTTSKMEEFKDRLLNAARIRESRACKCSELDAAYKRAQAARGYLTDLIECLDEKMPELEALESRALTLHRKRSDFIMERRRADMRDQAQDVLSVCARPGASKPPDSEDKRRRTAEREGRRRARRLKREAAAASSGVVPRHREGDSSDDELPSAMQLQMEQERVAIREASAALFADALPAWRDVHGVCAKLSRWRRRDPALYSDAYVCDCLPKLLAPYIRHQLILWNPLADEDNDDYERMDWYKCLMMYGVRNEKLASDSEDSGVDDREDDEGEVTHVSEAAVRSDPDLLLVPTIISKVVLPKLTELVEHAWDPMCVRACVRLRQLIVRAAAAPHARAALDKLASAAHARLLATINADVFLPALPPQIMEGAGGAFWRRCLGGGLRLARAALALAAPPPLLHADAHVLQLLDTLCMAAGAAPGPQVAQAAAALAETMPRSGELRARALARIGALAQRALARLETDNPLHLKALEQARNVLAEAKAAES